jgi:hypothetical protein
VWLRIPIFRSSVESEDSTSPCDSLCQRLSASAMWRSSFRQSQFWHRALKTVPWMMRLSGLTSEPSQQNSIVAAWLEQFSVSPARICLSQESKQDLREEPEADCFTTPCESFAKLDASGVFLRTSLQFSLFQQAIPYSENLPKAGSMRNGYLYERPMLALRTDEKECSSWPTARAEDSECCGNHPGVVDSLGGGSTGLEQWSTPIALDGSKQSARSHQGANLTRDAERWTTPQAHDSIGGNPERVRRHGSKHGCANLADDVTKWPTPTANDDNKSVEAHLAMKQRMGERDGSNSNRTAITSLSVKVKQWADE